MMNPTQNFSKRRYAGPVVDAVSGLNSNTRRAWEARGVLQANDAGYDFENLLRAAAGAELARQGIARAGTRNYLLKLIVQAMRAGSGQPTREPRYLVACDLPEPEDGSPVYRKQFTAIADGDGALCIAPDLSPQELAAHFSAMAAGGQVASFVIDTSGLLRRVLDRLDQLHEDRS